MDYPPIASMGGSAVPSAGGFGGRFGFFGSLFSSTQRTETAGPQSISQSIANMWSEEALADFENSDGEWLG